MRILLVLFLASELLIAQSFGIWKNYTDMSDIAALTVLEKGYAAATKGGFFIFTKSDSSYQKFTKSEGLKSQIVTAITKDKYGKIWLGTEEGFLHVYSPSTNQLETIRDIYSTDKTNKSINYLLASGDTIYVCTDFGLSLIDPISFTFYDTILKFDALPAESQVNSVFIGDRIYVATEVGFAMSKIGITNLTAPESWQSFDQSNGLNVNRVYNIDFYQNVVVATDKGVYSFDGTNWNRMFNLNVTAKVLKTVNNTLYFSTVKDTLSNKVISRIYSWDGSKLKSDYFQLDIEINYLVTDGNTLLLGTSDGIKELDGAKVNTYKPNGLVQNSVHRLTVDKSGNLWTVSGKSSSGAGINFYDGTIWRNFNKNTLPEYINNNAFYGVYAANDGKVYLGNWGDGFLVYDNGNFTKYNSDNTTLTGIQENLNYIVITDIELDDKGNIWLTNSETAASETINMMTPDGDEYHYVVRTPITPVDAECFNLAIDQYGTKWFNILSAVSGQIGLYYFNDNGTYDNTSDDTWGVISANDGLNSSTINEIVLDNRGELWLGTSLGINIIPNPNSPHSGISSSFPVRQQNVISIAVDPLNRKWVGTNEGVFLLSSDGTALLQTFTKDNSPLPSNTIKSISVDERTGVVYFATDFGISSYSSVSAKPNDDFSELFVYPNPVEISSNSSKQITIDGLVRETTLKILSVSGNLIRKIETPGGRVAFWDLKDENGNLVPSGIYIIVAYDSEANLVANTKVAIIRR